LKHLDYVFGVARIRKKVEVFEYAFSPEILLRAAVAWQPQAKLFTCDYDDPAQKNIRSRT
jgi:hypothetical protein